MAISAPAALAREAVAPLARAIRRFDLGGAIGIDFPSLERKEDRRAVDTALDAALGELAARAHGDERLRLRPVRRAGSSGRRCCIA